MADEKYCYPNSNVLINKLNITNNKDLYYAEVKLTSIRLRELQHRPITGKFDFKHLKKIHKYIFQDLYTWAGETRNVEIGKGNIFCTVRYIDDYAKSVFQNYFPQCNQYKDNIDKFVKVFAKNYADVNALHPFREGNGRAQREFARQICLTCGFDFTLSHTTHQNMLEASILSFNKGDNSKLEEIFRKAISSYDNIETFSCEAIRILTSDDLTITPSKDYDYCGDDDKKQMEKYHKFYKEKVQQLKKEILLEQEKFDD